MKRSVIVALVFIFGVWLVFRGYDLAGRTAWGVEQSFMYWGMKNVAVDHHFTLISTHFFSLVEGPLYRAPFYDWFLGGILAIVGFKITNIDYIFLLFSFLSLVLVMDLTRRIITMRAAVIVGALWASSWFTRQQELQLWNVSLMIFLTTAFAWWINGEMTGRKLLVGGVILGLGFSLHLITLWLVAAMVIYLFLLDRRRAFWQSILFLVGVGISISPLILFNFRHDFLMRRGVLNLITGSESGYSAGLIERLMLTGQTLRNLSGGIIGFGEKSIGPTAAVVVAILAGFRASSKKVRRFSLLTATFFGVTTAGIFLSGRVGFSSLHYTLPLIPLIYISLSLVLLNLLRSRLKVLAFLFFVLFIYSNLGQFMNFKVQNGYVDKLALVKFIYSISDGKTMNIRFVDQDVLAFDAVFYDASIQLGVPYNRVNLIERWGQGREDGTIVDSKLRLHD